MKRFFNSMVFAMLILFILCQTVCAARLLIPGGQLIGISLSDNTVTVAAFEPTAGDAAKSAGLRIGDQILKINETNVTSLQDVRDALTRCDGNVQLLIRRGDQQKTLQMTAAATANGPRLGIGLKEGVTGVGTVTYYDPQSKQFGALGHSVNNSAGQPVQMEAGTVFHAGVMSIRRGCVGEPGQLMGTLSDKTPIGKISKNTHQGIFGTLTEPISGEKLPAAEKGQVHTGAAVIRSTVADGGVQEYSVEILKIYPNPKCASRNMLLCITDPKLLETTGGIVQGMSGSPIIQDGKLVGAVTHVLVNDPTTGYGIFIENMLDAAA